MQALLLGRILLPFSILYLGSLVSFSQSLEDTPNRSPAFPAAQSSIKNAVLTYKIIDVPNKMYGYDILVNGKILIHQTNIPALAGNDGFVSQEDATKVARFVMDKMKHGQMPPALTLNELRELRVTQ